jgi:hypothetical protein
LNGEPAGESPHCLADHAKPEASRPIIYFFAFLPTLLFIFTKNGIQHFSIFAKIAFYFSRKTSTIFFFYITQGHYALVIELSFLASGSLLYIKRVFWQFWPSLAIF